MAYRTGIEWTDSTWNPVIGCTKVSPGCDHCYAEAYAERFRITEWGPDGERRRTSEANWRKPRMWNRQAEAAGQRHRVFCASLADVFDSRWPDGVRDDLWALVRDTPALDWQILTKRPQSIPRMLPDDWADGYPNVWLGVSTEDQERYDVRWPLLYRVPAAIRFVSYEPALGYINLMRPFPLSKRVPDWIIMGGESGPHARPMKVQWAESMRDQCGRAGVAFFMKQMAKRARIPDDLQIREFPA